MSICSTVVSDTLPTGNVSSVSYEMYTLRDMICVLSLLNNQDQAKYDTYVSGWASNLVHTNLIQTAVTHIQLWITYEK